MDELQIKHAFDQIEMYGNQLRNFLIDETGSKRDERIDELNEEIENLQEDLDDEKDEKRDLKIECDSLKESMDKVKLILEDLLSEQAGEDYYQERINEALELL